MMKAHTFHIPVMGIGFTIDSPLKVSRYGIDSVISLGDDMLMEKLRKMYCSLYKLPYTEITNHTIDFRAERITSYLNLMKELAEKKFEEFQSNLAQKGEELKEFLSMLPNGSEIRSQLQVLGGDLMDLGKLKAWLRENLTMGSIDVNVMTKLDKENFRNGEKMSFEYNDAHAAVRGFANSDLNSSMVLSAGMSPRLYSYIEQFEDFYPDEAGHMKKKIIIKVSDYRSAFVQGKFFAKKGLWVSEYRIESGLNCGGHAFATDGYLLGPILAEFCDHRKEMIATIFELYKASNQSKGRGMSMEVPEVKFTVQGGVGTAEEHDFLLNHYQLDSIGWGSPFLLVPEATTVDEATLEKLTLAEEKDLYLSGISPLGVPFNNLRGNTKDVEKYQLEAKGRPGSSCPKKYLALNKEFTEEAICTSSRQYVVLKLKELDAKDLSQHDYQIQYKKIVEKSCICVGLGTTALLSYNLDTKTEHDGVSVCPGPNMAYFSKVLSLREMTEHIYGRTNVISRTDRPNLFIKELNIYVTYLKEKISEIRSGYSEKDRNYFVGFMENLQSGIEYYETLFKSHSSPFHAIKDQLLKELNLKKQELNQMKLNIDLVAVC